MAESLNFDVSWGKLAAQAWGPINGRPTIALHGWLDNSASFEPLAPFLNPDLRVVAIDLGGHGLSDHRPPGTYYHLLDSIPDILEVADQLGWWQFNLIGHSLGGAIGALIPGAFPERIHRLALIESLGPFAMEAEETPDRIQEFYVEKKKLEKKRMPIYPSHADAVKARLTAGAMLVTSAETLARRGLKETEGGFTWRSDRRLRLPSIQRLSEAQILACLQRIACPTLLIRGEQGLQFSRPGIWEMRSAAVAQMQVRKLEGKHHLHMDAPEPTAELLNVFFRTDDSRNSAELTKQRQSSQHHRAPRDYRPK